jgi:hypothetical protein
MRDGIAPSRKFKRLFTTFKKAIYQDMHKRSERRKYEFYEDLEVKITPERKAFFDALMLGKRLKKQSIWPVLLEWYIYLMLAAGIILWLLSKG